MKPQCISDIIRAMDDATVKYNLEVADRQTLYPRFNYLWKWHTDILKGDSQCCSELDSVPSTLTGMNKIRYYAYITLLAWRIR